MTEREKHLALVLAVGLAVLILAAYILLFLPETTEEPAPEPQTETVETVNEAGGEALIMEAPAQAAQEEPLYGAAWLPEQDHWDTVTGIQDYMATYWPAGFDPEIEIYMGWKENDPRGWACLVRWGRGEEPPGQLPPPMEIACKLAAAAENIDGLLASRGSPLAGYGREFALAGYHHGINPYLLVGLAGKESSFATDGSYWRTNHNAWGMLGSCPGVERLNGACWWPDWPTAIDGAAYFVAHYWPGAWTAYDCRGYCVGNPSSWTSTVEAIRNQLGGGPW